MVTALVTTSAACARTAEAQTRTAASIALSRADVREAALARSPVARLAAADTLGAAAAVLAARQWENPLLSASLSGAAPQQHYLLDVPLDPWWIRTPRVAGAELARDAARARYRFARASIAFDADTAYTRLQLAAGHARLSTRSARAADSLLVLARVRRDAGDASDLDVELATVFAGQARNQAAADSAWQWQTVASLQALLGLPIDSVVIVPADSLELSARLNTTMATGAAPLLTAAAAYDAQAAAARVRAEVGRRFGAPALSMGIESGNNDRPNGGLIVAGVSIPLPILNRNAAGVLAARADLARADAARSLTQITTTNAIAAARRDAASSRARAERSAQLVASVTRIASLSLLAYREGAASLVTVLEAQRSAREALAQYYDDVAAARIAASQLDLLLTPATGPVP